MTVCPSNNYEYYIYSGLGLLVVISESLGLTKCIKSNSILEAIYLNVRGVLQTKTNIVGNTTPITPIVVEVVKVNPSRSLNEEKDEIRPNNTSAKQQESKLDQNV